MDTKCIETGYRSRSMARYKHYDLNQTKMIPLSYADQIVEGSFEHALNEIVEEHLDLAVFEHRYHNDETGRSAYDPKVLLKIVLYGYYRGIISSRPTQARARSPRDHRVETVHCERLPLRRSKRSMHQPSRAEAVPEGPSLKRRNKRDGPTQRTRWKFDTPLGREIYRRRMGTVEPVFADLQNKGMRRFTLRGQKKVSAQWKPFTMVHNIEKMAGAAMR
jgi:hypothetical protein